MELESDKGIPFKDLYLKDRVYRIRKNYENYVKRFTGRSFGLSYVRRWSLQTLTDKSCHTNFLLEDEIVYEYPSNSQEEQVRSQTVFSDLTRRITKSSTGRPSMSPSDSPPVSDTLGIVWYSRTFVLDGKR